MSKKPLKQQIRSVLRWAGWVLLVQIILINISAALYADKLTRYFENIPDNYSNSSGNVFTKSWKLFTGPRYAKPGIQHFPVRPYDTVKLVTKRGYMIDAWYIQPDSVSKGTVILFHGIGGTKSLLMDEANDFLYMGYDVLLVDFRGHGNSSGYRTTIGVKEAEEVKLAFDFIKDKGEKNIFLYGMSMGAVAITRAMHNYKLQASGLILEAPFWSLQTYLKTRARQLGFPSQPFAFFTTFWIGVENGFGGFKHKTARYVKSIDCPVLYQWGTLDEFVDESEMNRIYGATPSKNKKLAVYNGALHESLLRREPAKWRNETEQFLEVNRK